MADHVHLESPKQAELARKRELRDPVLALKAVECARTLIWVPATKRSDHFARRLKRLNERMQLVFAHIRHVSRKRGDITGEQRWLVENADLLRSQLARLNEMKDELRRTEHVRAPDGEIAPRVLVVAENLMSALNCCFNDNGFSSYVQAFQTVVILRLSELWEMIPALRLVLLERISDRALTEAANDGSVGEGTPISTCIRSLREIEHAPWNDLIEPLIVFDQILKADPAGAYAHMDAETREMYRQAVVMMAEHSDHSEVEVSEMAVSLARQSSRNRADNPRLALRERHVGYYLIAEGRELLYRRADVRLPFRDRLQAFLRRHPDEFYLLGIDVLTLGMILVILWWVNFGSLWGALFAALVLLIPCSQSAVEIMNYLTTSLLDPQRLPRLDFENGIPDECATMVVVPTLLLNKNQVRELVKELEVRYVGNMSANLHFALLTDLADSAEQPREDHPLVDYCGELIRELNRKYAVSGAGTFAMFHRHRVFNRREGVWMGWERKRGKLLDFNKLILREYDSFPYKVGDLSILARIRYVLTLDSDTELPRGSARRLIGTLAHPLCQAIIDSENNIVTRGYGILQPRVGVSVESTAQSRLASIYSGRTGFDIYTHATSDVYQDLYGEGTFVGKGIYELRTVHRVLDKRFPRNAILSHDLIEGAYTRSGLVSDVEVIDRYPSHYSAYIRRRHRWVRGDWQIAQWLFSQVPDEDGYRVPNPISLISRWKILDNLRRSTLEPATLAAFLLAWTVLAGRPLYWTLVLLGVLFLPTAFQFLAGLVSGAITRSVSAVENAWAALGNSIASVLLSVAFLLHDALVSTDAIWRSLYRVVFSRERLLQWETAAEAEVGARKRTPLDLYLLLTPVIAVGIAVALFFGDRRSLWVALPILALWACSKIISVWLDRPPRAEGKPIPRKQRLFLRRAALRTWRYFAELSNEEHNWLIPDNVQEEPVQVAARVSPTNLGFLLNARQVACEMGYLTVPEFVDQTRRTFDTMKRMRCHRGHLLNWYDTRTLSALEPLFLSSVDSGNLAASLITLKSGCKSLLERPLLSPALVEGYDDLLRALSDLKVLSSWRLRKAMRARRQLPFLHQVHQAISEMAVDDEAFRHRTDAQWFVNEVRLRTASLQNILSEYMPWLLPQFETVRRNLGIEAADARVHVPLEQLPAFVRELEIKLRNTAADLDRDRREWLLALLARAHTRADRLVQRLKSVADDAESWINGMDFSFLVEPRRKLLSIGYSVDTGTLHSACYDLLASESRIAAFIGIAKGEIPEDVWLRLGRTHVPSHGGPTLVSWAGSMFEYLMPAIWMRSYRDALLQRSMKGAVRAQQAYTADRRIPWGISESGYCDLDDAGSYRYQAFGVPELALQNQEVNRLVIAPYATALALALDPTGVIENSRRMVKRGWFGKYGFHEAIDFGSLDTARRDKWRVVKSWMAHHQGMTLLSIANFTCDNVVQRWFHDDVRVESAELLLQERTVLHHVRRAWHIRPPTVPVRIPGLMRNVAEEG
jgi:cyclic beta-1,2-glucan synthetase